MNATQEAHEPARGRLLLGLTALHATLSRPPELHTWSWRREWPWPLLVASGLFVVYALCSPRTIALEDDGLFVMASYFNGIAHPPGYPVFTLIGHLFSQLPFGSVAWRVHLVSALFGGLTCAVIWCIARSLVPSGAIAASAALAFGFSEAFWSQAIIAEVYTLNTFLTFLLVCLLLEMTRYQPGQGGDGVARVSPVAAMSLGFVCGLGLSNHWPLFVLFGPAYLVLAWPILGGLLRRSPWLVLGLAAGLLPYVWLYARSLMSPEISFSGPIDDARKFIDLLLRRTYATVDHEPGVGVSDKLGFIRFQISALADQLTIVGGGLALVGIAGFVTRQRVLVALLLGAFCTSFLLLFLLDREFSLVNVFVYRVYPLPAYGVVALCCALGMHFVVGRLAFASLPVGSRRVLRSLLLVAFPALPMIAHGSQNYRANYAWAEEYAKAVLDELPAGARLILYADADLSPVGYVHSVLGFREDVEVISGNGLVLKNRAFDPWVVQKDEHKAAVLEEIVRNTDRPSCYVSIARNLPLSSGVSWRGLTSCYLIDKEGVYNDIDASFPQQYARLQGLRTTDNWTMMVADTADANMVDVLLTRLTLGAGDQYAMLTEIVDRGRQGLRGSLAFVRNVRDLNQDLALDRQLAILDAAEELVPTRAYTKNDVVELYRLRAAILDEAGRSEVAEQELRKAIELKPTWRNKILSDLLTRLFRQERTESIDAIASLDPDLEIIGEVYEFYVENRGLPNLQLTMKREDKLITLKADGEIEIK